MAPPFAQAPIRAAKLVTGPEAVNVQRVPVAPSNFVEPTAAMPELIPMFTMRSCTSNLRLIRQPDRPGTIPSLLYLYEGLLPWSPLSFSTSWCSSPWCGCASCSSGCGQAPVLLLTRQHLNPRRYGTRAAARRNPLRASPASRTATPRRVPTRGRRRQVHTSIHFCPNPDCAYRGWVGWGNRRANGHPHGGPWRQLLCVVCRRYFLETLGTLFHGKRTSVDLIVRVIACLAEGLGI